MAMYVKSFHPRLVGLTGSPEEIEAVAKAYRVYFKRVPDPEIERGLHDGSFGHHLRYGTGRCVPHALPYTVNADAMADRLSKLLP
jgi:protein SCO1/2